VSDFLSRIIPLVAKLRGASAEDGDRDLRSSAGWRQSDTLVWRLNAIAKLLEIPPFISAERSERVGDRIVSALVYLSPPLLRRIVLPPSQFVEAPISREEREGERERQINLIPLQRYESYTIHPSGTFFGSIKPAFPRNFSSIEAEDPSIHERCL